MRPRITLNRYNQTRIALKNESTKHTRTTLCSSIAENYEIDPVKSPTEQIERYFEQKMLFRLFQILGESENQSATLIKIVNELPNGSRKKNQICAKITYAGSTYKSINFFFTINKLSEKFTSFSGNIGKIEIYYHNDFFESGNFAEIENGRELLRAVAEMLKTWINKKETEAELQNMIVNLESKIEQKTSALKETNENLLQLHKELNDSIHCANRIQKAILPNKKILGKIFNSAFVMYKPKDTISGDFYWVHRNNNKIFITCADCTGHGVPGALMSMVGFQLFEHVIIEKGITEPDQILHVIDQSIFKLFKKNYADSIPFDGMSLALCVIDLEQKKISYSGAFNNAYVMNRNGITTLPGDRVSVGGNNNEKGTIYKKTNVNYADGDRLYMFSDGFQDQFGGSFGKKFKRKNLLNLIHEQCMLPMSLQKLVFENAFEKWKGDQFQVDDVTLIGIEL